MCQEDAEELGQDDKPPDTSTGVRLPDGSTYYKVDGDSIIEVAPQPSSWW